MQLAEFLWGESTAAVKAVSVLTNQVMKHTMLFQGTQGHMCGCWDGFKSGCHSLGL